jgi:hypothetical protein
MENTSILAPEEEQFDYVVDQILPLGRVSIIAGVSGVGKTTLLMQLLRCWSNGEPFLGYETRFREGALALYVVGDRPAKEVRETMQRLKLPVGEHFQYKVLNRLTDLKENFYECPPNTKILVIDCAERLVENTRLSDQHAVLCTMLEAQKFAEERDITVIFLVGSPKQKKGQEYLNARESITGTGLWGRLASTVFSMAKTNPRDTNSLRELVITPVNHPEVKMNLRLVDGVLVPDAQVAAVEAADATDTVQTMNLLGLFGAEGFAPLLHGAEYTRGEIANVAMSKLGISDTTVDRSLKKLLEQKLLEKPSYGKYRKPLLQLPFMTKEVS